MVDDHKITIDCPVVKDTEIFSKIGHSISELKVVLNNHETRLDVVEVKADRAVTKVNYLYWFFATVAGLFSVGSIIWHMFTS